MISLKEELFDGYYIYCDIVQMGNDYTLAVYGGDTPHVGCTVMSVARPSLTGEELELRLLCWLESGIRMMWSQKHLLRQLRK